MVAAFYGKILKGNYKLEMREESEIAKELPREHQILFVSGIDLFILEAEGLSI